MPATTIRLVTDPGEGRPFEVQQFTTDDPAASLALRGLTVGLFSRPWQRPEIRDMPTIVGFAGPMWDGDAVRYEDAAANAVISR